MIKKAPRCEPTQAQSSSEPIVARQAQRRGIADHGTGHASPGMSVSLRYCDHWEVMEGLREVCMTQALDSSAELLDGSIVGWAGLIGPRAEGQILVMHTECAHWFGTCLTGDTREAQIASSARNSTSGGLRVVRAVRQAQGHFC